MDPVEIREKNMVRQGQKMDAYYGEIADSCALDKCMERAKKEFDWEKQFSLALDKSKPRTYREKCGLDDNEMCAMCGEYCAVKIAKGDF